VSGSPVRTSQLVIFVGACGVPSTVRPPPKDTMDTKPVVVLAIRRVSPPGLASRSFAPEFR
jgi:hypothetical protein